MEAVALYDFTFRYHSAPESFREILTQTFPPIRGKSVPKSNRKSAFSSQTRALGRPRGKKKKKEKRSLLLALPLEIRLQIYHYVTTKNTYDALVHIYMDKGQNIRYKSCENVPEGAVTGHRNCYWSAKKCALELQDPALELRLTCRQM